MPCVFCQIINKEAPATIVFEDEDFIAFLPLEPVGKGHTLIIPKAHAENLFDISPQTLEQLVGVAQQLALEIVQTTGATGVNLLHASGKDAQQSVFHFHLHIVPRFPDDGLDLWFKSNL